MKKASVGGIENAEAVFARLHVEIREGLSVHHHHVAENFGNPRLLGIAGHRIVELAVLTQQPVANHQRNLEAPLGRFSASSTSSRIRNRPNMSGIDVQPVDAHGVVVIPERGGVLVVGIEIGPRFSRHIPVLGIAVALRRSLRAVNVDHAAHFGLVRPPRRAGCGRSAGNAWRAVRWAIRSAVRGRCAFQMSGRAMIAVAPQARRRKIAVQFALDCRMGIRIVGNLRRNRQPGACRRLGNLGNRERIDKFGESVRIQRGGRGCSAARYAAEKCRVTDKDATSHHKTVLAARRKSPGARLKEQQIAKRTSW